MKALFITGGSMGTVFPQAPLARATRDAGHEILMAGPDTVTPTIAQAGLPPVSISAQTKQALDPNLPGDPAEQMRYVGRWYGRTTADALEPLQRIAADWRPDIVLGGGMFYPAALLGHILGVPTVLQPWGVLDAGGYDEGANEALRPVLDRLGLERTPAPDLALNVAPPSLRGPVTKGVQPLRWIPGNLQRPLEPWMYTRGTTKRVLLTSGSRVTREGTLHTMDVPTLRALAAAFTDMGVETVIAVPDDVAPLLRGEGDGWPRAGWVPLDIVAPTCDLIVHHGGVGSNMTAMAAGVPQLIVREIPSSGEMDPQVRFGSLVDLPPKEQSVDNIRAACAKILADPSYAERARILAEEIAVLPTPAEVVAVLEVLARR
ncbi:DUF1205 domain-containing protein [Streptomonospora sp. S1-112]|uniref:DUF1205 domain-containing protein n=1 Tax=Streptomonospora mangrovi TaxID=2883123 RepID=A0A9X3NQP7_9ACTN|nr:nucleotide disphospho-sugar-binding domain-containing protein [Streptomonospora mangrovi]MDA0567773.1 DUF1205 domain-containing protein [Streptomonospora mangrovi]